MYYKPHLSRQFLAILMVATLTISSGKADSGNLLVNGDFENNSAATSIVDASNNIFNVRMEDINAYGMREGIDILTFGGGALQNPQSGDWNLALKADQNGNSEEIAIPLIAQVQKHEHYRIEFYMKRLFSQTHEGGKVEFGISNDPSSFGWKIGESELAVSLQWRLFQVEFSAPTSGRYLTVRVDNSDNHFVGIDNLSLRHVQGNLLLNGDFEDNSVDTGGLFSIANDEFTGYMSNITAFGADNGLDIIPIDDDSGDNVMENPISGFWKVGGGLDTFDGVSEAFSFSLSAPVEAGQLYYLEYHIEKMMVFGETDDGFGASLSFGLSNFNDSAGFHIFQSPQADLGWTRHGMTFVAVINASYLTVTVNHTDNQWIGMDDFSLRQFLLGDVNFDGNVDLLDIQPFVEVLSNSIFLAEADINGDGTVDLLDVEEFVALLSG